MYSLTFFKFHNSNDDFCFCHIPLSLHLRIKFKFEFLLHLVLNFLIELLPYCFLIELSLILCVMLRNFFFNVVVNFLEELTHFIVHVCSLINMWFDLHQLCGIQAVIVFLYKDKRNVLLPDIRFLLKHLVFEWEIGLW